MDSEGLDRIVSKVEIEKKIFADKGVPATTQIH